MTLSDVVINTDREPYMSVHLKVTKTSRNASGVSIIIGCTGTEVWALCAMKAFLKVRMLFDNEPDKPLFMYNNGVVLSRQLLVNNTRLYLSMIGKDSSRYTGHSYRVGGATSAAASGFSDWEIMMLGRWSSDAYLRYIKTPISTRIAFAKRMVNLDNVLFSYEIPYHH